ncbi:hypothetical protein [Cellulosimicrobium sp. JZ28]|uniref:hypothetical protein n=1 Tax=Cellulosimicrobium sp. JZ28 TaxID=1906273 RepID=UPI00188A1B66|nr:hypothetical protein [Cellulosimicrobium sp. JZ28]
MALFRGLFVRKDATRGTTPVEARKALAGLLAPAGAFGARPGVLSGGRVTGTAGWAYQLGPSHVAVVRATADGVVLTGNDGNLSVSTNPAPASGSRIDIVWIRHLDIDAGDATSDIEVGVAKGAASGSPSEPSIPAGALELARATVGAGATNTNHANVTITQSGARTSGRGTPVPVRDKAERNAYATAFTGAGGIVSALSPLWVIRADAGEGREFEYTVDGTNWRTVPAERVVKIAPSEISSGWAPTAGSQYTPFLMRSGNSITMHGALSRSGGAAGSLLTVREGFRPGSPGSTFVGTTATSSGYVGALLLTGNSGNLSLPGAYGSGTLANTAVVPLVAHWTALDPADVDQVPAS